MRKKENDVENCSFSLSHWCKVLQESGSPENHFLLLTSLMSNLVQDLFHYREKEKVTNNIGGYINNNDINNNTHPGGGGSPWLTVFGGDWWSTAGGAGEATWLSAAET